MQGFPKGFKFPVSDIQAMKQLGNSVAVNAVQDYAAAILEVLDKRTK
jgi:DNA (cytosine-5)-methyltransferase 1